MILVLRASTVLIFTRGSSSSDFWQNVCVDAGLFVVSKIFPWDAV